MPGQQLIGVLHVRCWRPCWSVSGWAFWRRRSRRLSSPIFCRSACRCMVWLCRWGAGLAAFLVTAALLGRAGVADLGRRSVRWRVSVRWYLIPLLTIPVGVSLISLVIYGPRALAAPSGGWPRALAEVAAVFLLQLVLVQLAEEIGFTGFLQHHWQDRYHPLKLTLYVALMWALWHMTDHFAVEG